MLEFTNGFATRRFPTRARLISKEFDEFAREMASAKQAVTISDLLDRVECPAKIRGGANQPQTRVICAAGPCDCPAVHFGQRVAR